MDTVPSGHGFVDEPSVSDGLRSPARFRTAAEQLESIDIRQTNRKTSRDCCFHILVLLFFLDYESQYIAYKLLII